MKCDICKDSKWVLDKNVKNRSWILCECTLQNSVNRAYDILHKLSDGSVYFANATAALKRHPDFKKDDSK